MEKDYAEELFVYKKLVNDDDLEDEIELVDDGYFENVIKN